MATTTEDITADPVALVDRLQPEEIRSALSELARRREALLTLLRAAMARRRGERRQGTRGDRGE